MISKKKKKELKNEVYKFIKTTLKFEVDIYNNLNLYKENLEKSEYFFDNNYF